MHPGLSTTVPETLRRIVSSTNALLDNLDQAWTVQRLAEVAGFSEFYFSRLFREFFGEAPAEHIRRVRLERAGFMLLAWPDASTLDIAIACGFSSGAVFSRAFNAHFGMSPRFWRRERPWNPCGSFYCWRPSQACEHCVRPAGSWHSHLTHTGKINLHPLNLPRPAGIGLIEIVDRPSAQIAYLRSTGPAEEIAMSAWQQLIDHLGNTGGFHADLQCVGIMIDDPCICSPKQTRYDVGYFCRPEAPIDPNLHYRELPGGLFATARIQCRWFEIAEISRYMWFSWLAYNNEWRPRAWSDYGVVSARDYENPFVLLRPDTVLTWQIYLPIVRRSKIFAS